MRSAPWRPGAEFTLGVEAFVSRFSLPQVVLVSTTAALVLVPRDALAMHLSDGVIPGVWCVVWSLVALPFVAVSLRRFERDRATDPMSTPLTAMVGAAVFALSCMPIPVPLVGSCSHPCGTGLAAVLLGPSRAILLTVVALALQALFLAHGGLTTLGADVLSMGIAGGLTGYAAFLGARRLGVGLWGAAFLAGLVSDWATYATTAAELALGLHGDRSVAGLFVAAVVAFAPTQVPLGVLEGLLTAGALGFVLRRRPDLLRRSGIVSARAT